MPSPRRRHLFVSLLSLATAGAAGLAGVSARAAEPPAGPAAVSFAAVAAILERACIHCHGGDRPVEGLALDSHGAILKGGARGPVVVAGQPDKSALVARLRGTTEPRMPFDGDPLPQAEIQLVEEWIRAGAPGPEPVPAPKPPAIPVAPAAPVAPAGAADPAVPAAPVAPAPVRWSAVQPILRANCVRCHQTKGLRGAAPEGLRFDSYAVTVGGGERASVIPGRPDASPLIRAVRGQARKRMPLDGPPWLRPEAIALLERWVLEGARGDDGRAASIPAGRQVRLFGVFGVTEGVTRIDQIPLRIDADTGFDGRPAAGATFEVRATILPDGSLRATRIRPRSASDGSSGGSSPKADDHGGGKGRGSDDPPGDDHGGGKGRGGDDSGGDDHGGGRGRGGR